MKPRAAAPAVISLGSNIGDRRLNLLHAVDRIRRRMRLVRVSSLFETDPVEAPPGSPAFLNAVVLLLHYGGAERLLAEMLGVEEELGRVRRQKNGPRVIDLDLILYDAAVRSSRSLTLPHPRYREREFVLAPLREIAPWWVDPLDQTLVGSIRGHGEVRRIGPLLS
jgi:2-amino-4-hydroxy-6-hydroxymethyldihydropteridine diphosphokinase